MRVGSNLVISRKFEVEDKGSRLFQVMTSKDRARQLGTGPITTLEAVLLPRQRGRIPAWRGHLDRAPGRAAPALEPAPLAHRLVALSIIHQLLEVNHRRVSSCSARDRRPPRVAS